jgi:hypothetical protein
LITARTLGGPKEEQAVYFSDLHFVRNQLLLERFHALNSIAGSRLPLTELVQKQFALLAEREQRNHACDREEDEIRNHQLFNPGLLMVLVDIKGTDPILNHRNSGIPSLVSATRVLVSAITVPVAAIRALLMTATWEGRWWDGDGGYF